MDYLKCTYCGYFNEVKNEHLLFCLKCNKKIINNYVDWSKQNSEKTFEDYKRNICKSDIVEKIIEKPKFKRRNLIKYIIEVLIFIIIWITIVYIDGKENLGIFHKKIVIEEKLIDSTKTRLDDISSNINVSKEFIKANEMFSTDIKGSILLYENVLKNEALLNKKYWCELIDNLGVAYALTGDILSSEKIFKYGLSKDSTYALFYYNLACTYAEKNDMRSCINCLKSAYNYKGNIPKGATFPDPVTDGSFHKFIKNNEFLSALKKMKKNN
jgi:hypothetical protein